MVLSAPESNPRENVKSVWGACTKNDKIQMSRQLCWMDAKGKPSPTLYRIYQKNEKCQDSEGWQHSPSDWQHSSPEHPVEHCLDTQGLVRTFQVHRITSGAPIRSSRSIKVYWLDTLKFFPKHPCRCQGNGGKWKKLKQIHEIPPPQGCTLPYQNPFAVPRNLECSYRLDR